MPKRILLQTTIPRDPDDWDISRFELLAEFLDSQVAPDGSRLFSVTARNRDSATGPDPILSRLDEADFAEAWIFGVDTGSGLSPEDCLAINRFRERGGGLLVTRDHMDLGSSVCSLGSIGKAHHFHSLNPEPDPLRLKIDDPFTTQILWPNYHSGSNGDFQEIAAEGPIHPVLYGHGGPASPIRHLPAHPHEGVVSAPSSDGSARVIATGRSRITGAKFNIAVAFEPVSGLGPAIAQSTFHHFVDYNWDIRTGCPSFVEEPVGVSMATSPTALQSTKAYMRNVAHWLAGITP